MLIDLSVEKGSIEIFHSLPDELQQFSVRDAITSGARMDFGTALFHARPGRHFSVWSNHYFIKAPGVMRARGSGTLVEFRCALKKTLHGFWEGKKEPALPPYTFSVDTTPLINTRALLDGPAEYETFDIQYERAYFEENRLDCNILDDFLTSVDNEQPMELAKIPLPCPPDMRRAIREILDNPYDSAFQPWLLESNVKIILISALHTVMYAGKKTDLRLTPHQTNALYDIRHLIETHIDTPFPNEDLCGKFKMTEEVLLVGFRILFDTTPYDYHMQVKFLEAERLLNSGQESVVGVAYSLGYRHVATFCAEFKRRFGYTAGDYKASRKKSGK